jgi:hypothetical protein
MEGERRGGLPAGGHLPRLEQYEQVEPWFAFRVALATQPFFEGIELFSNRG